MESNIPKIETLEVQQEKPVVENKTTETQTVSLTEDLPILGEIKTIKNTDGTTTKIKRLPEGGYIDSTTNRDDTQTIIRIYDKDGKFKSEQKISRKTKGDNLVKERSFISLLEGFKNEARIRQQKKEQLKRANLSEAEEKKLREEIQQSMEAEENKLQFYKLLDNDSLRRIQEAIEDGKTEKTLDVVDDNKKDLTQKEYSQSQEIENSGFHEKGFAYIRIVEANGNVLYEKIQIDKILYIKSKKEYVIYYTNQKGVKGSYILKQIGGDENLKTTEWYEKLIQTTATNNYNEPGKQQSYKKDTNRDFKKEKSIDERIAELDKIIEETEKEIALLKKKILKNKKGRQ